MSNKYSIIGNTPLKEKKEYKPNIKKKKSKRKVNKNKGIIKTFLHITSITLFLGISNVYTKSVVYQEQSQLMILEEDLSKQNDLTEYYNVELLKYSSFDMISECAKNVGLKAATEENVVFIDCSKSYFSHLAN